MRPPEKLDMQMTGVGVPVGRVPLRRITREELHDAAWSAKRFRVAGRFGLSAQVFVA